jgi:Ca-activated chloride channel family protein
MNFLWEELLWLFLFVPALVAVYVALMRRRAKQVFRYPGIALIGDALDATAPWRTHVPAALALTAVCAFLAASARPVLVDSIPIGPRKLIVAVDVSYSMAAQDVQPSRLALAKALAESVVRWQPQDVHVGIIAFGANANLVQAPTSERRRVLDRIASLELQPGSAIGTGLLAALMTVFPHARLGGSYDVFGRDVPWWVYGQTDASSGPEDTRASTAPGSYRYARILLLSDGFSTAGVPAPIAIEAATRLGVPVYTVGIGTMAGRIEHHASPGSPAGFDEAMLMAMAANTRGRYWNGARIADRTELLRSVEAALQYAPQGAELSLNDSAVGALLLDAAEVGSLDGWPRLPYGR